jgi:hypothetical protein
VAEQQLNWAEGLQCVGRHLQREARTTPQQIAGHRMAIPAIGIKLG